MAGVGIGRLLLVGCAAVVGCVHADRQEAYRCLARSPSQRTRRSSARAMLGVGVLVRGELDLPHVSGQSVDRDRLHGDARHGGRLRLVPRRRCSSSVRRARGNLRQPCPSGSHCARRAVARREDHGADARPVPPSSSLASGSSTGRRPLPAPACAHPTDTAPLSTSSRQVAGHDAHCIRRDERLAPQPCTGIASTRFRAKRLRALGSSARSASSFPSDGAAPGMDYVSLAVALEEIAAGRRRDVDDRQRAELGRLRSDQRVRHRRAEGKISARRSRAANGSAASA